MYTSLTLLKTGSYDTVSLFPTVPTRLAVAVIILQSTKADSERRNSNGNSHAH